MSRDRADIMAFSALQDEAESSSSPLNGRRAPLRSVVHRRHHVSPPAHHVVQPSNTLAQVWRENVPLMPTLMPTQSETLYSTEKTSVFLNAGPDRTSSSPQAEESDRETTGRKPDDKGSSNDYVRIGFQNPWNSWHKPTLSEVWNGLRWGWGGQKGSNDEEMERLRGAIEVARQRESGQFDDNVASNEHKQSATEAKEQGKAPFDGVESGDLSMQMPDFSPSVHDEDHVRATWLGHATVYLQFPSLHKNCAKPIRVLFDPIFSLRCSPTQYLGPVRLFPAPCSVVDLPSIDVVCISHSHYDHLDYDSIVQLWQANKDHLRFVVPLGNKLWFLGLGVGVEEDRVVELDWWDEVWLTDDNGSEADTNNDDDAFRLRFICTPAQHGSGRYGFDAGRSLWSSWTVERTPIEQDSTTENTFRAFFGGDSGFQFHSSSPQATEYTTCPAFEEVNRVIGVPNVSFLPISVGATLNFVKSYDTFGLMPDMDNGLTGANHMTPFDAVRVARILAGDGDHITQGRTSDPPNTTDTRTSSLALAIHWGTFVSGMDEIRKSMRDLEAACNAQQVEYIRRWKDARQSESKLTFACVDHGDTVWISLPR